MKIYPLFISLAKSSLLSSWTFLSFLCMETPWFPPLTIYLFSKCLCLLSWLLTIKMPIIVLLAMFARRRKLLFCGRPLINSLTKGIKWSISWNRFSKKYSTTKVQGGRQKKVRVSSQDWRKDLSTTFLKQFQNCWGSCKQKRKKFQFFQKSMRQISKRHKKMKFKTQEKSKTNRS